MSSQKRLHTQFVFSEKYIHVFVCDSENDMETLSGNYSLGISHVSYITECSRINFAILSGWSVMSLQYVAT